MGRGHGVKVRVCSGGDAGGQTTSQTPEVSAQHAEERDPWGLKFSSLCGLMFAHS